MNTPSERVYRIENVEVHTSRACLVQDDQEHYLRQKTFQVLLHLLEHRDRVVPKVELVEAVWKDTAVTDDALVHCIGEARRALGDDPRRPRFIKTVSKWGYRFIGPVDEVTLALPATNASAPAAEESDVHSPTSIEDVAPSSIQASLAVETPSRGNSWARMHWAMASFAVASLALAGLAAVAGARWWPSAASFVPETMLSSIPGTRRVAVMYFENQSDSRDLAWLSQGLADMVITDLSRIETVSVLSRQQLDVLMDRNGIQRSGPFSLDQILDIARRSGAEAVVSGSFGALGERVRVEVRVHDGASGQLLGANSVVADEPEEILGQIDTLAASVAIRLGMSPGATFAKSSLVDVMTSNLEAYRYYVLGVEKSKAFHSVEALELLQKAVALDPEFAMAHARIGYTYGVSLNYGDRAKPHLENAFQLSARLTEKDKLYIAAWYAIANEDFPSAVPPFREIIAKYPYETEAYWRLGFILQGEERRADARAVFERGLMIDPENKDLLNLLGMLSSYEGRHEEAITLLQRAVSLASQEANVHDSLGMAYQSAGQYEHAIESYRKAIDLDPGFEIAVVHLGNVYFQAGRYQDSLEQFHRYIEVADFDEERARGYNCIAWVYFKKGDFERARNAAAKARTLGGRWGVETIVIELAHAGDLPAKELAQALSPYSARGGRGSRRSEQYLRGQVALAQGRRAEALDHFKAAVGHLPITWNVDAFEDCLANAYLELGQVDEAIGEYERALRVNPNLALARYHLGRAFDQKGDKVRAEAEYERFLVVWRDADPDIPELVDAKHRLGS